MEEKLFNKKFVWSILGGIAAVALVVYLIMWCTLRRNGGMALISQRVHRGIRGVRSGSVGYIVTAAGRNRSRGLGSPMTGRSPSLERVLGSPDRTFW